MNLPAVTINDLLDQTKASEERSALWSQVVVRAVIERASEPVWLPAPSPDIEKAMSAAS